MGMYATVLGEEMKMSGIVARAVNALKIPVSQGVVELHYNDVKNVVAMGLNLLRHDGKEIDTLYDLRSLEFDAHKLVLLSEWIISVDKNETLTFC
jgi:hypothetical protein